MAQPSSWAYARGPYRVDYEQRVDPHRLQKARVARARKHMRAAGIDALLLWKNENVRYLTGLRAQIIAGKSALLNGCLLARRAAGAARLGRRDRALPDVMPWIEELHAVPIMEAARARPRRPSNIRSSRCSRAAVRRGVLGLDEAETSLFHALHELLPGVTIADGDAPMPRA